jgi:hypothetical protein
VLGGEIVKLLPSGGNMAVFVGTLSADNAAQRFKGIQDAVSGHKIVVVDRREDGTDRAKARSNVEDIVNAHRDLNLVAGLWSYNGPAIAAAIESLGKKGKVLAAVFDEEAGTLQAITDRTIAVTVVQAVRVGYLIANGSTTCDEEWRRHGHSVSKMIDGRSSHHQGQRGGVLETARRAHAVARARHESRARASPAARDAGDHQDVPRGDGAEPCLVAAQRG